jgi:formate C-acetyltransferase
VEENPVRDTPTANESVRAFFQHIAGAIGSTPALQRHLKSSQGWIDAAIGFRSEDGAVEQAVVIEGGRIHVRDRIPAALDATVVFASRDDILAQLEASPDEAYKMILRGKVRTEGNAFILGLWEYLANLVVGEAQQQSVTALIESHATANRALGQGAATAGRGARRRRAAGRLRAEPADPGVRHLDDPYLSRLGIEDFPRLERFRAEYFAARPEVTAEYGRLLTDFFLQHGYETRADGSPWEPNLRRAMSLRHVMAQREPVIRENDLVAGSYTPNPVSGIVGHPHSVGPYLWGELRSCRGRELEPYEISDETIRVLHTHVYPYWAGRNILSLWRSEYENPLGAKIHDRLFAIFFYKVVSNMQISPGYEKLLRRGLMGIRDEVDRELKGDPVADEEKTNTLEAMKIGLDAVALYARRLARQAAMQAEVETHPARAAELEELQRILSRVPMHPAETLHEAIQSLWIMQIALGLETMDDGPSLGRLDQILQPYFEADLEKLSSPAQRESYIRRAIELVGCLFLRLASHQILLPDFANWLNSGAPPNATIVVGGVTPDGRDAVNDMSYVILKVTEMLGLNEPNVHARYKPDTNSRCFLRRACEVNYITGATPALHGDDAMFAALSANDGWRLEDIREWVPTGCVEPTLPGMHASATSSLEVNLVAALEMALNDGRHPLMNWQLGPRTGRIEDGAFGSFEEFMGAFEKQCTFLLEQSVVGNNQLGEIYQRHLPGPLLSTLIDGCIATGRGVTRGGARYNSTGASIIGLSDVVDSLMAIEKLVFEQGLLTFAELKQAIDRDFEGHATTHALVKSRVARFGSGDPEAAAMANRVTHVVSDYYRTQRNHRGGHYASGWWTMNNHTVFGRVTGALPSGRRDGEPFTPGLTPHPSASTNLLDNLMDVAQLDPTCLDNNIAFNVRLVPSANDTHEQTVDRMADYVRAYFESGGMQIQFNVVDTDTLRDAMANPELYQDLLVRISGYCGYFTRLHRDLQLEIIRRSEYGL